jgi:RNA polymerase sigma-70 factor (ECF subfamily)
VEGALAGLSSRNKLLLRLSLVQGLPTTALAKIYKVNQSTAWRWIRQATEQLREEVQRWLAEHSELDPAELASIVALVQSRIQLSLTALTMPMDED